MIEGEKDERQDANRNRIWLFIVTPSESATLANVHQILTMATELPEEQTSVEAQAVVQIASYSFSAGTDKAVASPLLDHSVFKGQYKERYRRLLQILKDDNTFFLIKPAKSRQPGSAGSVLLASLHRNNFPMSVESKKKIKTSSLE